MFAGNGGEDAAFPRGIFSNKSGNFRLMECSYFSCSAKKSTQKNAGKGEHPVAIPRICRECLLFNDGALILHTQAPQHPLPFHGRVSQLGRVHRARLAWSCWGVPHVGADAHIRPSLRPARRRSPRGVTSNKGGQGAGTFCGMSLPSAPRLPGKIGAPIGPLARWGKDEQGSGRSFRHSWRKRSPAYFARTRFPRMPPSALREGLLHGSLGCFPLRGMFRR